MTVDKAIINLITLHKVLFEDTDPIFLNSLKLGIEALKHEKLGRELGDIPKGYLLPGETED